MVMALAGNKADLADSRKVTTEASVFIFHYQCGFLQYFVILLFIDGIIEVWLWETFTLWESQ